MAKKKSKGTTFVFWQILRSRQNLKFYDTKNSNFQFSSFRLEGMDASAKKDAGVGREQPDKEAPPQDEESFDGEITESDQI